MKSVEEICKIAADMYGTIHLSNIIEDEQVYHLFLTDQYGNAFDGLPLSFDKKTGKPAAVAEDDPSYNGIYRPVPSEYSSQKDLLLERLVAECEKSQMNLGEYQIRLALNSLFLQEYWDLELHAMYAVCSYYLSIISGFCTEEETNDIFKLIYNEHVRAFLRCSREEKLAQSREFHLIPDYVQNYIDRSEVILHCAMKRLKNEDFDPDEYRAAKQTLCQWKDGVLAEIQRTEDLFVDTAFLLEKIEWIDEQAAIEYAYCEKESDVKSERMSVELFDVPDASFGGDVFGEIKPFGGNSVTFKGPNDI